MQNKQMKDKSNPLLQQDNKLYKHIFRMIFIIIYLIFLIGFEGVVNNYFSEVSLLEDYIGAVIIDAIIVILYTWFIFGKVLNKNARRSMEAMRGTCTYKEMYDLLSNQAFKKVNNAGAEDLEESELWLKVEGVFVQKNFIVAGHTSERIHGSTHFWLVLLNGRYVKYTIGTKKEWLENTIQYFTETIPHAYYSDFFYYNKHEGKTGVQLEEKFKKYKEEGNSIDNLISSYTDFSEGIDYLTFSKQERGY